MKDLRHLRDYCLVFVMLNGNLYKSEQSRLTKHPFLVQLLDLAFLLYWCLQVVAVWCQILRLNCDFYLCDGTILVTV